MKIKMKMYLPIVFSPDPNPFYATVTFYAPWKHQQTQRFSDVQGLQKETRGINELTSTSRSKLFISKLSINHMAEWNLFDVVNSVILKSPAVVFSFYKYSNINFNYNNYYKKSQ